MKDVLFELVICDEIHFFQLQYYF